MFELHQCKLKRRAGTLDPRLPEAGDAEGAFSGDGAADGFGDDDAAGATVFAGRGVLGGGAGDGDGEAGFDEGDAVISAEEAGDGGADVDAGDDGGVGGSAMPPGDGMSRAVSLVDLLAEQPLRLPGRAGPVRAPPPGRRPKGPTSYSGRSGNHEKKYGTFKLIL